MDNYFVIGKIVNTQGIKGEMRVLPMTEDVKRFDELDFIYLDLKGKIEKYNIKSIRYHKQFVLINLEGITDMTSAERLKGAEIKITEDMVLPLDENEYYIRDIYDMEVVTEEGEFLGSIKDIIYTGANDVYCVKDNEGNEILIPAIKQCILNVDVMNKKMTVKLLEGLR